MKLTKDFISIKSKILFAQILLSLSTVTFALPPGAPAQLPGSVEPGRISGRLSPETPIQPGAEQAVAPKPETTKSTLGEAAKKIKFTLTKIILEDNTVYSGPVIRTIYENKLGKQITVAELQDIVQSITNYYRNSGYILSRAILPPQHVTNGVVHIRVLEGYVDQARVIGTARGARSLVQAFGNHITDSKPLQIKDMEKNLLLANQIPGVQVKAVIEPSKTQKAASDIDLNTQTSRGSGFVSYDNYGTRYSGPQEITSGVEGYSLFRPGDLTRVTYATTSKGNELQYKDIYYDAALGTYGSRISFDANQAITNPLFILQPLQVAGNAKTYSGTITYPVIRSRAENLSLQGAWSYQDSYVTQFDFPLYTDHIRYVRFGGVYDFADRFKGANVLSFAVEKGLNVLGASNNPQSFQTSRYGATGVYTKLNAQVARNQLVYGPVSAFALVKGQYSFSPLLSAAQFGFGGAQLGRGYDPAEIIGDRGAAGSVEVRFDVAPGHPILQSAQFYAFYDAGVTWNMRNVIQNLSTKLTATSTGIGVRLYMLKYLSGNLTYAQPLTRQVQSLELIGNGKCPRVLFSLTAATN